MKILSSSDPNPWGTPLVTNVHQDIEPLTTILWMKLSKLSNQFLIHQVFNPSNTYLSNLESRVLWGTRNLRIWHPQLSSCYQGIDLVSHCLVHVRSLILPLARQGLFSKNNFGWKCFFLLGVNLGYQANCFTMVYLTNCVAEVYIYIFIPVRTMWFPLIWWNYFVARSQ